MESKEEAIQRLRDLILEGKNSPPAGVADKAYFDQLRDFLRQDKWQRHSQFPVPDSIEDPLRGPPAITNDQLDYEVPGSSSKAGTEKDGSEEV